MRIDKNRTYKLALFGDPVSHSLSPIIHQQFAREFNIKVDYCLVRTSCALLKNNILSFFNAGGLGANVTLPHKQQVIDSLSNITDVAKSSNAVNTIYLNSDLELCGTNTDGSGFITDLNSRGHFEITGSKILILGAGGAAQGVLSAIMAQNPKYVYVANRSLDKAKMICGFENSYAIPLKCLNELDIQFDLIIHASSLGHQNQTLKFNKNNTHKNTLCYDLSYGRAALPFLRLCNEIGLINKLDGIGMLIEQAACSFETWFGVKPNTDINLAT